MLQMPLRRDSSWLKDQQRAFKYVWKFGLCNRGDTCIITDNVTSMAGRSWNLGGRHWLNRRGS